MSDKHQALRLAAKNLLDQIELSTDCMSNQIKRENIDNQIDILERDLVEASCMPMKFHVQELRPEVLAFALLMEARLREKDADKGQGWKKKTDIDLTVNVCTAARQIEQALFPHKNERSIKALVDMSNHCMMLADVLGALETEENGGDGRAWRDQTEPSAVYDDFLKKGHG